MKCVKPIEYDINNLIQTQSEVPSDGPYIYTNASSDFDSVPAGEWDSTIRYAQRERVLVTDRFDTKYYKIYDSTKNDNISNFPPLNTSEKVGSEDASWVEVSSSNKWACFDFSPSTVSKKEGDLIIEIRPEEPFSSVTGINVRASEVTVTTYDSNDEKINEYNYDLSKDEDISFFDDETGQFDLEKEFFITGINEGLEDNVKVEIVFSSSDLEVTQCGLLLLGPVTTIGKTVHGTELSIEDYSTVERDEFGQVDVVRREYAQRINFDIALHRNDVRSVQRFFAKNRAEKLVFVGGQEPARYIIFGFYEDLRLPVETPTICQTSIEVLGLTVGEQIVDATKEIKKPKITSPENAELFGYPANDGVEKEVSLLEADSFTPVNEPEETHEDTQFVLLDGEENRYIWDDEDTLDEAEESYTLSSSEKADLTPNTYYLRVRYKGDDIGWSDYSDFVLFYVDEIKQASVDSPSDGSTYKSDDLGITLSVSDIKTELENQELLDNYKSVFYPYKVELDGSYTEYSERESEDSSRKTIFDFVTGTQKLAWRHRFYNETLGYSSYTDYAEITTDLPKGVYLVSQQGPIHKVNTETMNFVERGSTNNSSQYDGVFGKDGYIYTITNSPQYSVKQFDVNTMSLASEVVQDTPLAYIEYVLDQFILVGAEESLTKYDISTGELDHETDFIDSGSQFSLISYDPVRESIFAFDSENKVMYEFDKSDLSVSNSNDLSDKISGAGTYPLNMEVDFADDGYLFFYWDVDDNDVQKLVIVEKDTLSIVDTVEPSDGRSVTAITYGYDDNLYVGLNNAEIYKYEVNSDGSLDEVLVSDNLPSQRMNTLIYSDNNFLYANVGDSGTTLYEINPTELVVERDFVASRMSGPAFLLFDENKSEIIDDIE